MVYCDIFHSLLLALLKRGSYRIWLVGDISGAEERWSRAEEVRLCWRYSGWQLQLLTTRRKALKLTYLKDAKLISFPRLLCQYYRAAA